MAYCRRGVGSRVMFRFPGVWLMHRHRLVVQYDNEDNFIMTNKIATSKAVTAVLAGLLSVVGLFAQTSIEQQAQKYRESQKWRTAMISNLVVRVAYFSGGAACSFVGNVEEVGGVTWRNLELSIKLSGVPNGNPVSIDIPIRIESIDGHQHQEVKAACHDKPWPQFTPTEMTAKVINGTPTKSADEGGAYGGSVLTQISASYAKLPILNVGSSVAFLASDRKCAQEFQQVFSMEGMEKGKRINELIQYHCGSVIDVPVRLEALSVDASEAITDGSAYIKVTVADCVSGVKNCPVGNENAKGKTGWVLAKWVTNY